MTQSAPIGSELLSRVRRPSRAVGIVGYGAYIPRYRLRTREVNRLWRGDETDGPILEKAVAGPDEDTLTIGLEAARNALRRASLEPEQIGGVWVGTESKPYAVKPTATILAQALGVSPYIQASDVEFACKGGSEALQIAVSMVGSGMMDYALVVGADTAQSRPGDALECTAASGGACVIVGPAEESFVVLEGSLSYVSDTPDFFRRQHEHYPEHGHRFTGERAYFHHTKESVRSMLLGLEREPHEFSHVIFHQPNKKFPEKVSTQLGFARHQIEVGLLSPRIGNTYAGAALLGLTAVLDRAEVGERILLATFGSGAGSDVFSFVVRKGLQPCRGLAPTTEQYILRRRPLDYATYARYRGKIQVERG